MSLLIRQSEHLTKIHEILASENNALPTPC